jgi:hypothetical protein
MAYRQYLENFENGLENVDEHLILAKALAQETHKPFIFISTLGEHANNQFFTFQKESAKPPIIFGIYKAENELVFYTFLYTSACNLLTVRDINKLPRVKDS